MKPKAVPDKKPKAVNTSKSSISDYGSYNDESSHRSHKSFRYSAGSAEKKPQEVYSVASNISDKKIHASKEGEKKGDSKEGDSKEGDSKKGGNEGDSKKGDKESDSKKDKDGTTSKRSISKIGTYSPELSSHASDKKDDYDEEKWKETPSVSHHEISTVKPSEINTNVPQTDIGGESGKENDKTKDPFKKDKEASNPSIKVLPNADEDDIYHNSGDDSDKKTSTKPEESKPKGPNENSKRSIVPQSKKSIIPQSKKSIFDDIGDLYGESPNKGSISKGSHSSDSKGKKSY